ncbi:hypothetical protein CDAR_370801 [Caerostris darwini]|uniref:Uncharacterized protein n=1 Tax=Caerostris darwini TaxID=1538125 RepID=A0AAV4VFY7_9ARAC|nr:hypothetical protein CDAR_370801 [Caerostris darwini]
MVTFNTMSSEECSTKIGEKEPMLNHSRDETPAAPPVRNRRQSAIDRAARLVDIHHTVVHVSTEIAVAGEVVKSPERTGNGSPGSSLLTKSECQVSNSPGIGIGNKTIDP